MKNLTFIKKFQIPKAAYSSIDKMFTEEEIDFVSRMEKETFTEEDVDAMGIVPEKRFLETATGEGSFSHCGSGYGNLSDFGFLQQA